MVDRVAPLLQLCLRAGDAICRHYHALVRPRPPGRPVATHPGGCRILRAVAGRAAGVGWLDSRVVGGVPPADLLGRRSWRRYWLVDPLDGTKEFLAATGEFTINIALIEDHRPVLGYYTCRLERSACVGIPGVSAHRYQQGRAGRGHDLTWRFVRLFAAGREPHGAGQPSPPEWPAGGLPSPGCVVTGGQLPGWTAVVPSSSASWPGEGDFYPRFRPAAGGTPRQDRCSEAAGGACWGWTACRCGTIAGILLSPHFLAVADPGHLLWRELLAELPF